MTAALIDTYRKAREHYRACVAREDAAFGRYFAKVRNGEPTNGAAVSRLANLTSYASADLAVAQGKLYALEIDPWDVDDADGVERTPIGYD